VCRMIDMDGRGVSSVDLCSSSSSFLVLVVLKLFSLKLLFYTSPSPNEVHLRTENEFSSELKERDTI
jgi:hypothetical protein